jgi:hypothetical protein
MGVFWLRRGQEWMDLHTVHAFTHAKSQGKTINADNYGYALAA